MSWEHNKTNIFSAKKKKKKSNLKTRNKRKKIEKFLEIGIKKCGFSEPAINIGYETQAVTAVTVAQFT